MAKLPPSSKYLQRPDAPVDEVERDSITKRLSDAYTDGRITQDEYMSSLDVVYVATRLGDLVPVVEKLPAAAVNVPAIVKQGSVPAGSTNQSRNVLPVAMVAVGTVVSLVAVLAILLVILL